MNLGNKLSRRRKDDPSADRDDQRKRPSSQASSAASSSAGSRMPRTENSGGAGSGAETGARMIADSYRELMRSGTSTGGRRRESPASHASGTSGGGGIGGVNNPRRRSNDRGTGPTAMPSSTNGGGRRDGGYRRRSSNEGDGYQDRPKSFAPPASASASAPAREAAARPARRENIGESGVPGHHRQARQNLRTRDGGRRLSGDHGGRVDTGATPAHLHPARRSGNGGDEPTDSQQPQKMDGGTVLLRRSSADSDAGESGSDVRKPRYMKRRERGSQQQQQRSSSMDMLSDLDGLKTIGPSGPAHAASAAKPDVANFHASMPTSSLIGDFSDSRRRSNEGATSKHYFSARPRSTVNGSAASSTIRPGAVAVSGKAPDGLEAKKHAAATYGRRSSTDTTSNDGFDDLDDENGGSADPINEMRALKDTHISRTNELLFDVFPAHVARALRDGKKVEPEEKEMCTIFFSDIVGYTDLVSRLLTPIQVSDLLDRLYSEFDDISEFHGVHKMETIGDAWMGVTNLIRPQDKDHCRRIALFARDVISAANKTPIDEEDPSLGFVNLRVGFHSGPVVATVVGRKNPRYCLFGDTVNVASRMESKSVKNRIQCSAASAQILKEQAPDIRLQCRGEVAVKGKGVMKTYWVLHDGEDAVNISASDEEESRVTTDTPVSRISVDTPIKSMSSASSAKKPSSPQSEGADGDVSESLKRLGLSEEDIAEQRRLWERLSTSNESNKIAATSSGDIDAVTDSQQKLGLSRNEIDEQRRMWMQVETRKRNSERDLDAQLRNSKTSGSSNNARSQASGRSGKTTIPRRLSNGSMMALQAAMKEDGYK